MTDTTDLNEDELTAEDLALLDGGEPAPDDQEETEPAYTPGIDLPDFEGHRVAGVTTNLAAVAVEAIARALHHDDTVTLIVEAKVTDVGHPRKDGQITRAHKLKATTVLEIADRTYADDLLRTLRRARLKAEDAASGRTAMEIRTDANGTVLTPGDLAGDEPLPPLPADGAEVVVVFADGQRAFWPDDFAADVERPGVGDRVAIADDDEPGLVVQLLDPVRGDVIAEHDPADEARQDREATLDLEVARLLAGTVAAVAGRVARRDDDELLAAALSAEAEGKARKGVVAAIQARLRVLDRLAAGCTCDEQPCDCSTIYGESD